MKKKTVLISGAGGYIALHIAQALQQQGYLIRKASRNMDADFFMDFSMPNSISSLRAGGIDAMIHTVSPHEALYKSDPLRALAEQTVGIHSALDFCVNNRIQDFIYFSSFHVFGVSSGRLVETSPVAPCNDYGLAHCIAEQAALMYDRQQKVNAWILRPSNLFGVPVDCDIFKRWSLIPFAFCQEAVEHGTITLRTPGNQLRNFVGVSDVCKIVSHVLEQRPKERIFHAYGNQTLSVFQYAQLVQRIALDVFGLTVHIIRPDGRETCPEFEFLSLYDQLTPAEPLDTFIEKMLAVLLTR